MSIEDKKAAATMVVKNGPFHHMEREDLGFRGSRIRDKCSVDIIVPYHGKYDLVRKLLLSIIRKTRSNPYLVTLVDDGSKGHAADEFARTLKQAPQTQILRIDEQSGFGNAINVGLKATNQPYICVIHSDCEIKHMNWLESMGEALVLNKDDDVRLVVPLSDNPGDNSPESMCVTYDDFKTPEIAIAIADTPLPMYCFMCHRTLFDRVGSIKNYPYHGYEDQEFGFRMKHFGYKQAIANESWVHHQGSATINYVLTSHPNPREVENAMAENRQRCITELKALFRQNA